MRKILFLALITCFTVFTSCSVDDGTVAVQFEAIPIENVLIPTEFNLGDTHTITVTYKRPTDCHTFSNFEYIAESSNVRIVTVVNLFTTGGDCTALTDNFQSQTFNFNVLDTNPYTFKFWQGKDSNGDDMYLEYEIPVNN